MRHGDKVNNLSRTKGHRTALMRGLACQLIDHKRIVTTLAKAKALRVYVEPIITRSKANTTHQRRLAFGTLNDKSAVTELFTVVSPKVADRPGGYTRIIKLGKRVGDNGELAMIELVDFNEVYGRDKEEAAAKKRTRRGGRAKKATDAVDEVEAKAEPDAEKTDTSVTAQAQPAVAAEHKADAEPKKEEKAESGNEDAEAPASEKE